MLSADFSVVSCMALNSLLRGDNYVRYIFRLVDRTSIFVDIHVFVYRGNFFFEILVPLTLSVYVRSPPPWDLLSLDKLSGKIKPLAGHFSKFARHIQRVQRILHTLALLYSIRILACL